MDAAPDGNRADLLAEHADLLAEHANDVVCLSDRQGCIRWISPAACQQFDQAPQDLIGTCLLDLVAEEDRDLLGRMLRHPGSEWGERCLRLKRGDAAPSWMGISLQPIDSSSAPEEVVSCWRNRTAERELRDQLSRIQATDPLTGLAHGEVLLDRLQQRLSAAGTGLNTVALLCIGIDQLSKVNGALSHRAGDRLMADLASRLAAASGPEDLLARGHGDSFLVLLHDTVSAEASGTAAAERLRQACREPVDLDGQVFHPSVSIGIAVAAPGATADELLRDAHLAMRQASAEGRDRWVLAHRDLTEQPRRLLHLQQEIRSALDAEAFQAWFMPVVDLATSTCLGFEALMRWVRADGSVLMPDEVLPTARGSALAEAIDLAVLRQSIQRLAVLPADHFVAANMTPSTLGHPDLADLICGWLEEADVTPKRLHLEITETDLLTLSPSILQTIERLAALGVRWWIDDFGTGFSSISHLRDLPIHGIKLDRSFTAAIGEGDQKSVHLAQALAGMAEGLGLDTVAEGVETAEAATFLHQLGWHAGQGWFFGQPSPDPAVPAPDRLCAAAPGPIDSFDNPAMVLRRHWALAVTDHVPVGLYALRMTPEGEPRFLFLSRRWLQMLNLSREAVMADPSLAFGRIHPEDIEDFDRSWRVSVAQVEALLWEGRLLVDGTCTWIRIEGIPQLQADGNSVWQGVMSDITASKRQEQDRQRTLDHAPVAIVALDLTEPDPRVSYLNNMFRRTFGFEHSDIPRQSDWARLSFPDPDYRAALLAGWWQELEECRSGTGALKPMEVRACTADGRVLDVLVSAELLDDTLLLSLSDITLRRKAERQLQQANNALAETALAITEAIPVGTYTMVLPPQGGMASFSFMSERFLEITGLEREVAAADPLQAFACVHPDDHDSWVQRNAEVFATKAPFYGETRIIVRGEVRWVSAESVPRDLPDGSTVWEGVLIDITDRIQAQQRLSQETERLQLLAENASDVVLTLQHSGLVDWVSSSLTTQLGWHPEQIMGAPLTRLLVPEDHDRLQAIQVNTRPGDVVRLEVRALTNRGDTRWMALRLRALPADQQGQVPMVVGLRDIQQEMDAREAMAFEKQRLAESEERYRLLAENSSDVVMQIGHDGRIRWVSPSLTSMLGWEPADWIGRVGTEFLEHQGDTPDYQANMAALAAGRSVVARDRIRSRAGRWHWVETHACPFRTASGAIDGIVAFFRTIDAEVEAEEALAIQARSDALTGLANRRETLLRLQQLSEADILAKGTVALAFCDLDRFKRINDEHGHATGDAVLVATGERLRAVLRPQDLVGRIGGDELLVALIGVDGLEQALSLAERMRHAMRQPLTHGEIQVTVTLSIGVTLFCEGDSVDAVVARADAAMYEAKQAGRDRVITIGSP